MRKIFLLIIMAAVGILLYLSNNRIPRLDFNKPNTQESFKPNPSNATFAFEDGLITLSGGKSEEVTLLDKLAYGDINTDYKTDAAMFLSQSSGGTGIFIYLATFVSGPLNYKGSNAVFLGDRISLQNISIKNGVITVEYLDRKPDEGFAAEPTIPVSKQFVFRNGILEEK
ncbi:MAG: hypothetical protein HYS51_02635 [Candidatus Zambryskibacteria bacterium]|nr:hypothetical protein [Candidatus Zambryskibacteria bacterium]